MTDETLTTNCDELTLSDFIEGENDLIKYNGSIDTDKVREAIKHLKNESKLISGRNNAELKQIWFELINKIFGTKLTVDLE